MAISRLCFKLLRQMRANSPTNAAHLVPYMDVLLFLESCNVQASVAFQGLVEHSSQLSDDGMFEALDKVRQLNERVRLAAYIDAMTAFCTQASGTAAVVRLLSTHQKTLTNSQVDMGRLLVRADGGKIGGMDGGGYENAMPIDIFIAHGELGAVAYYASCTKLVLAIAKSRDAAHAQWCREKISREEILIVLSSGFRDAKSQDLADAIKATHVELALLLYLSYDLCVLLAPRLMVVAPGQQQQESALQRSQQPLSLASPQRGSGGTATGEGAFVRQMKLVALEYIKSNAVQVLDSPGKNSLLCWCIVVWHMLVKSRVASIGELKEVMSLLIDVLDGATDVASLTTTESDWNRYSVTDGAAIILKTKMEICSLLGTYFELTCEDCVSSAVEGVAQANKGPREVFDSAIETFEEGVSCFDMPAFSRILLDLALYDSPELVCAATNLLSRTAYLRKTVSDDVATLCVLSPEDTHAYDTITGLIVELQAERSSQMQAPWNSAATGAGSSAPPSGAFGGSTRRSSVVPDLNNSGHFSAPTRDMEAAMMILQRLISALATVVPTGALSQHSQSVFDSAATEPSPFGPGGSSSDVAYLDLLRTWNIHTLVLDLLPEQATPENYKIFELCCRFLMIFCQNEANRAIIAPSWPRFFEAMECCAELRLGVLQLLGFIWADGNLVCPAQTPDIQIVVALLSSQECRQPAVRALVSLLGGKVPSPAQQREVSVLIAELEILQTQWWLTMPPETVMVVVQLLEMCSRGNDFTRHVLRTKFPLSAALRVLASAGGANQTAFKTVLARFITGMHLAKTDARHQMARQFDDGAGRQVAEDETWWRLVRDDFLVRLEELAAGRDDPVSIRPYVFEVTLAMEAFFANHFHISQIAKMDWLLKELRGVVVTVTTVMVALPRMDVSESERRSFVSLGETLAGVAGTLTDGNTAKLSLTITEYHQTVSVIKQAAPAPKKSSDVSPASFSSASFGGASLPS